MLPNILSPSLMNDPSLPGADPDMVTVRSPAVPGAIAHEARSLPLLPVPAPDWIYGGDGAYLTDIPGADLSAAAFAAYPAATQAAMRASGLWAPGLLPVEDTDHATAK